MPGAGVEGEQALHDAGPPADGGMRPPWRSRPSWCFSVQMIASTRCRSQFGKYRDCFIVLAGRADQGQASSLARVGGQADSAASEPYRWRVGHTWDAAQPSIDVTSVAAGHGTQTNLNHGGL